MVTFTFDVLLVETHFQFTQLPLFSVTCYSSVQHFSLSCECAATATGTVFRCHMTLICLAVSMATVSLVAGGWQSNGTNVQVRVLNETTGPQLEIIQISPTAGDYRCMCLSSSLAFRLSLTLAVCISLCLKYFSVTAIFVTF